MRLAPGGLRLVAAFVAVGVVLAVGLAPIAGVVAWAGAIAVAVVYRDPERTPPASGAVAPADGTVRAVETTAEGRLRVVIFLNLWHVHVVRAPWAGTVASRRRIDGHRRPAFLASAADNAGVELAVGGGTLALQAGLLARRVRVYPDAGDAIERAQRVGHIAFGSRVSVTFPATVTRADLLVEEGARTRAGETRLLAVAPSG